MKDNDELIKHLIEAQKDIDHAVKDAKNPFFKSQYATLEAVIETAKSAFNKHGIYFQQVAKEYERGASVETIFYGHGGVLQTGCVQVPTDKFDPQAYGGALTYARRYSLSLACGISSKDDDGESAMQRDKVEGKYKLMGMRDNLVFDTDDLSKYIEQCRLHMGKPTTKRCKDYFNNNKFNIKLALKDAKGSNVASSGKIVTALESLINCYEVSTDD